MIMKFRAESKSLKSTSNQPCQAFARQGLIRLDMRPFFLICLCHWQILYGQVPYFNVQFDYQNGLETSGFGIETDSFYII
jgi:hypothetical protein